MSLPIRANCYGASHQAPGIAPDFCELEKTFSVAPPSIRLARLGTGLRPATPYLCCRFRRIGYGACRPPPLVSPRELTAGLGGPLLPRAAVGLSCVPSFRLRDLTGDRLSEGGGLDLFSCHHGSYRALSGVSLGPLWDFMPLFHRRHAGQGFSAGCRSETCMGAFAALLLHCLITTLNPFSEAKKNAVERNS